MVGGFEMAAVGLIGGIVGGITGSLSANWLRDRVNQIEHEQLNMSIQKIGGKLGGRKPMNEVEAILDFVAQNPEVAKQIGAKLGLHPQEELGGGY